jgi:hypothetical protein
MLLMQLRRPTLFMVKYGKRTKALARSTENPGDLRFDRWQQAPFIWYI